MLRDLERLGLADRMKPLGEQVRLNASVTFDRMRPVDRAPSLHLPTFLNQMHDNLMTRPGDVQAMFDAVPAREKTLHWIHGTSARWNGNLEFQRRPQPVLEWLDTHMAWTGLPVLRQEHAKGTGTTSADEAEIRQQRERWKEAVEACDVDRVMSFYVKGAEHLGFDVMPPFRYDGSDAFRNNWIRFFEQFEGAPYFEFAEMTIYCSGDVALSAASPTSRA